MGVTLVRIPAMENISRQNGAFWTEKRSKISNEQNVLLQFPSGKSSKKSFIILVPEWRRNVGPARGHGQRGH